MSAYQPKTGERCHCKPIRARTQLPAALVVLDRYTNRNSYPLAYATGNGAFAIVGEVTSRGGMEAEDRALADAIAQAYNSRGELVKALTRLEAAVSAQQQALTVQTLNEVAEAQDCARALIAKAGQ